MPNCTIGLVVAINKMREEKKEKQYAQPKQIVSACSAALRIYMFHALPTSLSLARFLSPGLHSYSLAFIKAAILPFPPLSRSLSLTNNLLC